MKLFTITIDYQFNNVHIRFIFVGYLLFSVYFI